MDRPVSLSHTTGVRKYPVVLIPKCRRRTLYAPLRRHLGEVFHHLAWQKESTIEEGHGLPDHVPMLIAIPPKYAGGAALATPISRFERLVNESPRLCWGMVTY
jgi:putative transposase